MSEVKVNKISPSSGTAFTMGDSGDTFTVPSGATIVNSGTATGFGGGKIGQVLCATKTDTESFTETDWVDITDLTIAITPAATTSKIWWSYQVGASSTGGYSSTKIVYGTGSELTTQAIGDAASSRRQSTGGQLYDPTAIHMSNNVAFGLDSPATTSATTYKIQIYPNGATTYVGRATTDDDSINNVRTYCSIVVMEVLA